MDKSKLQEIELKLNPKTNGFLLFKENVGAVGWGMRTADQGLEAETNILPPKENEFQEGLNMPKKRPFKTGDSVQVYEIPEGSAMDWLNGTIGQVLGPTEPSLSNDERVEAFFKKTPETVIADVTYAIPIKYLRHVDNQTEIHEVSPYEEADWLQSEIHKQEKKQIKEWLNTTPEPFDDFHWDGKDLIIMKEGKIVETIERTTLAENKIIPEKRELQESHKYDYGCLMTYIDVPMWNDILSMIEPDDLYTEEDDFGLERKPHATILFGLHHNEINLEGLKKEFMDIDEIPIQVNGISHFDNENEPYDVVKFDLESDTLNQLNRKLQKYPHTNEFDYHPHMTIAYVKKGIGSKYDGEFPSLPTVLGKHIVYSHPSGQKDRWELPIQSDVMNSVDDLLEGLNLPKKKATVNAITEIDELQYIDGSLIKFHPKQRLNYDIIEGVENWDGNWQDNWQNLEVKCRDLNNNTTRATLGDFRDVYFKMGSDYWYLMDDEVFTIQSVGAFFLNKFINNDTNKILSVESINFMEELKAALDSDVDVTFICSVLSDIDYSPGRPNSQAFDYSDVEDPSNIIYIRDGFYVLMDGDIIPASVKLH